MNVISIPWCGVFITVFAWAVPVLADGGWADQSIPLQAGWNLVWLDVDPVPDDPAAALADIDCESIWCFVPGRASGDRGTWVSYHTSQPAYLNTTAQSKLKKGPVRVR